MTGDVLVKAFMVEHRIGAKDLFRSRFAEHTALRGKAIRQLRGSGLKVAATADAMQCSEQTVKYHMNREWRDREIARRVLHYPSIKKFKVLAQALEELYA